MRDACIKNLLLGKFKNPIRKSVTISLILGSGLKGIWVGLRDIESYPNFLFWARRGILVCFSFCRIVCLCWRVFSLCLIVCLCWRVWWGLLFKRVPFRFPVWTDRTQVVEVFLRHPCFKIDLSFYWTRYQINWPSLDIECCFRICSRWTQIKR